MKTNKIPKNKFKRMLSWTWRQQSKTPICPMTPSLEGKIIVITGGNQGIGLETVKGLLERKAEVIMLSRDEKKAENIIQGLEGKIHFIKLDLADITSIPLSIDTLEDTLWGRKIDILINNAGIAVKDYHHISPQGYELTFTVNVLGHHVLFKECIEKSLLKSDAQIIAITGDIYTLADNCTPDFEYEGKSGVQAYSRSKVGVMWWAYECHKLYPDYKVNIVHPGVVPMGLGADQSSLVTRILGSLLLSPKGGAQMTLICATQPDIENGAYYHNTLGKVILPISDIALNIKSSKAFWDTLEDIYKKWI